MYELKKSDFYPVKTLTNAHRQFGHFGWRIDNCTHQFDSSILPVWQTEFFQMPGFESIPSQYEHEALRDWLITYPKALLWKWYCRWVRENRITTGLQLSEWIVFSWFSPFSWFRWSVLPSGECHYTQQKINICWTWKNLIPDAWSFSWDNEKYLTYSSSFYFQCNYRSNWRKSWINQCCHTRLCCTSHMGLCKCRFCQRLDEIQTPHCFSLSANNIRSGNSEQ